MILLPNVFLRKSIILSLNRMKPIRNALVRSENLSIRCLTSSADAKKSDKNVQKSFKKSCFFNDFWCFFDDFWSILKHFRVVFWDFLLFLGWQPTKCSISELRWSCGTVCCINYAQMNQTSRLETPLSRQKKVRPLY